MTERYADFLAAKRLIAPALGFTVADDDLSPLLFPFQRDLTRWALRQGRAALFADTGLGKTFMQLEWARCVHERTGRPVLILAPLAVCDQTISEAARLGVAVTYSRDQGDVGEGIAITNYERLHLFDPTAFAGVVLDESSILKAFSGVTKKALVAAFRATPYRLCCTATPAPNDTEELCNHADFLGVMAPNEMRSTFFVAKSRDRYHAHYRLKGHARAAFFRWLASWAMSLKSPADLGYPADDYILPPLEIAPEVVRSEWKPDGKLFATGLAGVTERAQARRATLAERVARTAALITAEPDEPYIAWVGLNDEGDALARLIPDAMQVTGSDAPEVKAAALARFRAGDVRVLITKIAIAGFGMNFQHCARMVFCGIGDSYEQYYQAIRRCYRFGQHRPVRAVIIHADVEADIYHNVLRKERDAAALSAELIANVATYEQAEIGTAAARADAYAPALPMALPPWMHTEEGEVA